jgi:uncharacterized protein YjbI with pentapeptide repeats
MIPKKILIILLAIGVLVMVVNHALPSMPKNVSEINANPSIMNGLRFHSGSLEGLDVRNAHIKGMIFDDVYAQGSRFVNVTFEDCTFIKTNFRRSYFENVAFINCTLKNNGSPDDLINITNLEYSTFHDVLFDNTSFHNVEITGLSGKGGFLLFRNMRQFTPGGGDQSSLANGGYLHTRMIDSKLSNVYIINGSSPKKASLYIRNSDLFRFSLKSDFIAIDNCRLDRGHIERGQIVRMTNSVIDTANIVVPGKGYFVDNQYIDNKPPTPHIVEGLVSYSAVLFSGGKDGLLYFPSIKADPPAHLSFESGNIIIKDAVLHQPGFKRGNIQSLDLKNVRMLGMACIGVTIEQGRWENVVIEPPMVGINSRLRNIQTYNLQFPKGQTWQNPEGEFVFETTASPAPFEWEDIPIPTDEDMGIVWWPEKDPGYRADYVPLPEEKPENKREE